MRFAMLALAWQSANGLRSCKPFFTVLLCWRTAGRARRARRALAGEHKGSLERPTKLIRLFRQTAMCFVRPKEDHQHDDDDGGGGGDDADVDDVDDDAIMQSSNGTIKR